MRSANPLLIFSILIAVGIWDAWDGHIKVVIFLIAAVILLVVVQFGIGWLLFRIGRLWHKPKNRKPN
jgi:hypothetical protein